jgi:hypothetical protein
MEAQRAMRDEKILFLVLTNYDFRSVAGGAMLSGGLQNTLQPLTDEDYRMSLVVRALDLSPPMVKPMGIIADETDPATRERALCLTPSL